jgi:hypothetical protein
VGAGAGPELVVTGLVVSLPWLVVVVPAAVGVSAAPCEVELVGTNVDENSARVGSLGHTPGAF